MNFKKEIVFYGLIFSVGAILISLIQLQFTAEKWLQIALTIFSVLLMLFCISFGMFKIVKKHEIKRAFSFSQMLKIGIGIAFVGAVVIAVYQLIFSYLCPEDLQKSIAIEFEKYKQEFPETDQETLTKIWESMQKSIQPWVQFSLFWLKNLFFGVVISLGAASILKITQK